MNKLRLFFSCFIYTVFLITPAFAQKIEMFVRHCHYSDASGHKQRHPFFSREACFNNLINTLDPNLVNVTIILDTYYPMEGTHFVKKQTKYPVIEISEGNEAGAFLRLLDTITSCNFDPETIIYIVEDDYLHRPNWPKILLEGFTIPEASYVTLYDHNDKYRRGYETLKSKIFTTSSCHWRGTPSTTNTYAMTFKTLQRDLETHKKYSMGRRVSADHEKFCDLASQGHMLISSIPGWSGHMEPGFTSPCIDWEKVQAETTSNVSHPSAKLLPNIHPIQFGISEEKIVKEIPKKDLDFAEITPGPGLSRNYIYDNEADYYKGYQRAYYGITRKRAGWDCMRHYEILANGCIPYFIDLDKCDPNVMVFLPKELILEAMRLPGVSEGKIDHTLFDEKRYFALLEKILDHTRKHLTTKAMANYVLTTSGYSGEGKILFLSNDINPDYMRCCLLEGLKQNLGTRVVDVPKIPHIYKSYTGDIKRLYGRGFSYSKLLDDLPVDRENIEQRIKDKEFDLIIYGSVHRGLRHLELVQSVYPQDKIIYICGEDEHVCEYAPHCKNFFLREIQTPKTPE